MRRSGGRDFETVVEPDGRRGHWIRVDEVLQRVAGLSPGETAELALQVAPEWPEPDVPDHLAAALAEAPAKIRDVWAEITPMARWEWVRWVQATRNTTICGPPHALKQGSARPSHGRPGAVP